LEEIRETTSIQRKQQELQLQKQRVGLERKEEKLKRLRGDRRKMEITAPRDGVVYYGENKRGKWTDVSTIEAMLQPGGMVKPKAVVLTVVQPEPLRIRVSVPEASVRHFPAGAEVTINPVAYPDQKLSAKVQELSPVPMADGTFDAFLKVDVSRIDGRIVPGMKAKLSLTPAEK
jgi:multidrug resistance efflux pump